MKSYNWIDPEEIELYRSPSRSKYIILATAVIAITAFIVWLGSMGANVVEFMDVYADAVRGL